MSGKAKCKKCGKELEIDASKILTSNPPKYEGKCEHCKEISYYELHEISWVGIIGEINYNGLDGITTVPSPNHYNWMKANQCNHFIDIKAVSGSYVTYCVKCGKIFDTQPCFRPEFTCSSK